MSGQLKSGIDTQFMNPAVRPQDDLFRHFAGTWLDTYEIPADRASDGVTRTLYDIAEVQVREIIETATGAGEETPSTRILPAVTLSLNSAQPETPAATVEPFRTAAVTWLPPE